MGRLDVDAMLEEMTPEQLVEWRAAVEAVGVDGIQRQIARLALFVIQAFAAFGDDKQELPTEDQLMGLLTTEAPKQAVEFESGEKLYAKFKQAFG